MMAQAAPLIIDRSGAGVPVVMIHGLGGTSNSFQPLLAALDGYHVIRPDLPGSGRSETPMEALSIEGHAASVLAALTALGVARAHFVGHSMGTLIAQHIAATAQDCVLSLTLFGALTEPPEAARAGLATRAALARQGDMAPIADQIILGTLSPHNREHSPAAAAFVRESILRQPPEGYARNCEALARARAIDGRAITAPTLLVAGDADPVAPASMAHILSDTIADTQLSMLDRCGHWITLEQPQASARLLADFLSRHRS
jgi:3-oxoadipate enol-lactonase